MIRRTARQERTLRKELEGFREHAEKVRCHLIPRLW
jgi:hypothetical protein